MDFDFEDYGKKLEEAQEQEVQKFARELEAFYPVSDALNQEAAEEFNVTNEILAQGRQTFEARYQNNKARIEEQYGTPECTRADCFEVLHAESELAQCENCKGFPCQKKLNKTFRAKIVYDDRIKRLCVRYYFCEYEKERRFQKETEKLLGKSQIPKEYQGKTWEDYQVDEFNDLAVKVAKRLIEVEGKGAFFYGNVGTGKTLLASIIAGEMVKKRQGVIFITVPTISSQLRSTFKPNSPVTETAILEKLYTVPVLILDDVGLEKSTRFICGILANIFNERYNRNLKTIITSNYTPENLEYIFNHPSDDGESLDGSRIYDRWKKMCFPVELKGKSRR